jgi:DNA repair exonuclease SbcCD ATPase subunit
VNLGRDKLAALEQKLESARAQLSEATAAISGEEATLAAGLEQRDEAIEDPTLFADLSRSVSDHRSELKRLQLVLERREGEVAQLEEELALARYQAAASAANDVGERVEKAQRRVIDLVDQLANACDELDGARDRWRDACAHADQLHVSDDPSAVVDVDPPGYAVPQLRGLVEWLTTEWDRAARRAGQRRAAEQSEQLHAQLAAAPSKRAEEIVEQAYARADAEAERRGEPVKPRFNDLIAGEGTAVEKDVQRLVHERERARKREPAAA